MAHLVEVVPVDHTSHLKLAQLLEQHLFADSHDLAPQRPEPQRLSVKCQMIVGFHLPAITRNAGPSPQLNDSGRLTADHLGGAGQHHLPKRTFLIRSILGAVRGDARVRRWPLDRLQPRGVDLRGRRPQRRRFRIDSRRPRPGARCTVIGAAAIGHARARLAAAVAALAHNDQVGQVRLTSARRLLAVAGSSPDAAVAAASLNVAASAAKHVAAGRRQLLDAVRHLTTVMLNESDETALRPQLRLTRLAPTRHRFLEDRRVLYDPHEVEMAEHCVESVLSIRGYLTDVLTRGHIDSTLVDSLRAMRTACRTFLRRLRVNPEAHIIEMARNYRHDNPYSNGMNDWMLNQAIGELRGVFGVHIALLAGRYGIDVEDDLASILPAEAE